MREVVIVSAARTPIGSFNRALKGIPATKLGSLVVAEAVKRAGLEPGQVDEVIMGNVISAGLGQAPYLLDQAREGYRMGHATVIDAMIHDGLWDPYHDFHMGICGELCAAGYQISREAQDDYAIQSYQRALKAQREGKFQAEIVPVEVAARKGEIYLFEEDEDPKRFDPGRLKQLQPTFKPDGTITPGNASSVNDGAAALTVISLERAQALDLQPVARIVGSATTSVKRRSSRGPLHNG